MEILSVGIDDLMADPTQPRKTFLKEEIERLAESIKARGLLQPLRVLRDDERGCWLIVTGESRWRAARIAGLTHVPCILIDGQPEEADLLADRIVENACRNDLLPLDFARAIARLKAMRRATSQQIAKELGLSGAAVTRAESLLTLPEDIQSLVDSGAVPGSTAYVISRLPDEQEQRELAAAVAAKRMNRDDATDAVRTAVGGRNKKPSDARLSRKLDGGVFVTVSAGRTLTQADVRAAIAWLREKTKQLPAEDKPEEATAGDNGDAALAQLS